VPEGLGMFTFERTNIVTTGGQ